MHPDRVLRRFDAWEALTRGASTRPYRVPLEPDFRPLFARQRVDRGVIDDARKPSLLQQLLAPAIQPRSSGQGTAGVPEPCPGPSHPVELELRARSDWSPQKGFGGALLASLAGVSHHLAFEVVGTPQRVVVQLVCDEGDVRTVETPFRAHSPELRLRRRSSALRDEWDAGDGVAVIAPLSLSDRVFRMLRQATQTPIDPLSEIVGHLDDLGDGELALVQVLFAPTRFDWRSELEEFVSHIDDVDKVLPRIHEKFSGPTFAAVVRVAARAPTEEAAIARAQRLFRAVVAITASDENGLVLGRSGRHSFRVEAEDLLARQTRRRGMILAASELETLVRVPSASIRSPKLARTLSRTKNAPSALVQPGVVLGINEHDDTETIVSLGWAERLRHMHVIGASGSGKSTLLLSLAIQDIEAGNGFAVIDPHGDLIEDVLARIPEERANDVVLIDPSDEEFPVGFNPLRAHSDIERTLLASDFVSVFRRLSCTTFGDQMVSVLGNAVQAFLESERGGTLLDLRNFLSDKAYRSQFLRTVKDPEVHRYWSEEFPLLKGGSHIAILGRLSTFLRPKTLRYMVAQRDDRIDLRALMDGQKIILAKLSQGLIGEENSHLLGSLLVSRISQAAMSRQDEAAASRTPFTLYIDEFHHYVTPSVAAVLTSARKYGLGLCLAHQEMRQVRSRSEDVAGAVLANAYTRVVFQVGDADARQLAEGFASFEASDLQTLPVGRAIARVGRADCDFNLRTVQPRGTCQGV